MKSDYSDTTVIIPTLNENETIGELVKLLTSKHKNISVTISDDGSTDGTRGTILKIGKKNGRVKFLDRRRDNIRGLTASVLDAALRAKTKKIVVMDGDLQHPYDRVMSIADALDRYDIVIGVRTYIRNWGLLRRIISKGMSYSAYIIFKFRGNKTCNDMMSGFFGIRTELFKELIKKNRRRFVMKGYKVLLDTLRITDKKTTTGEVYYSTFHDRRRGRSKFGFNQVINTLKSTLKG